MVEISESYRGSKQPQWIRLTVNRLLDSLPPGYLSGLGIIVLTDAELVGRGKTRRVRGRKHNRNKCLGFYHARTRGEAAWIELVADNIVAGLPRPLSRVQFIRDIVVSQTLFHEIGHHLDATLGSGAPSGEAAAEDWCRRLSRMHFRKRYWYLKPVIKAGLTLLWLIRRLTSRLSGPASSAVRTS
jgi:hypothetical protein